MFKLKEKFVGSTIKKGPIHIGLHSDLTPSQIDIIIGLGFGSYFEEKATKKGTKK